MSIWPRWLQGLYINFLGLMAMQVTTIVTSSFTIKVTPIVPPSTLKQSPAPIESAPSFAGHAHHTGADIRDRGRNCIAGHGFVLVVLGGLNGRPSLEILDAKEVWIK
jgi:hypothetical protein